MMTLRILWGALLAATILYLVIFFVAGPQTDVPPEPAIGIALAVAAVVVTLISFVLPRNLHRAAIARAKLEIEDAPDPSASVMGFAGRGPTIRVFAQPDAARARAFVLFFTPAILAFALSEAVATFGLVLALIGFPLHWALPFFVLSWTLFLLRVPTYARVYGPLEAIHGAKIVDRA